jgi:solute carrier family 25 phosphate transporter 23/24/25/41
VVDAFSTMIRTEGFFSLYKGLMPSMLQIMPQTGVQFATFRLFSDAYWVIAKGG